MPVLEGFVPWPERDAVRYVAAGYWRGRSLGEWFCSWTDEYGDRVAVVDADVRLTYSQLAARVDGLANGLLDLGLVAQDTMLVQLPNSWEFVVLTLACFRAGIVPVMAMPQHRRRELEYLADLATVSAYAVPGVYRGFDHQACATELAARGSDAALVLVSGGATERGNHDLGTLADPSGGSAAARARLDASPPAGGDVAVLLLSGGTTGLPKLIPRTHNDYEYNCRASSLVSGFDRDTVYLVALPAGHNFPLACPGLLGTLLHGGKVVLADSPDPARCFPLMAQERVTATATVPAVAQRWLEAVAERGADELAALRVLQVGGARLAPEIAQRVGPTFGCTLQQVFGMAEGLLNYTGLHDPDDVICETQGRPISPDDEIRIVDEAEDDVPDGVAGSLLTRGPYTLRGYFRAPEHNERAFTRDGWYRTGDVVRLHRSGNLMVEGRTKDLINRAGEKISAEEVENLLYSVPGVLHAAAVAMPDKQVGERICVYVVLGSDAAGLTLENVREMLLKLEIGRYKLPEHLVIVDQLPLTNVGKVDKAGLRRDITERLERNEPSA